MPLTQLPSLKSALRQRRFSAEVGRALEPFPRLLEDLLDAWHLGQSGWDGEVGVGWVMPGGVGGCWGVGGGGV